MWACLRARSSPRRRPPTGHIGWRRSVVRIVMPAWSTPAIESSFVCVPAPVRRWCACACSRSIRNTGTTPSWMPHPCRPPGGRCRRPVWCGATSSAAISPSAGYRARTRGGRGQAHSRRRRDSRRCRPRGVGRERGAAGGGAGSGGPRPPRFYGRRIACIVRVSRRTRGAKGGSRCLRRTQRAKGRRAGQA